MCLNLFQVMLSLSPLSALLLPHFHNQRAHQTGWVIIIISLIFRGSSYQRSLHKVAHDHTHVLVSFIVLYLLVDDWVPAESTELSYLWLKFRNYRCFLQQQFGKIQGIGQTLTIFQYCKFIWFKWMRTYYSPYMKWFASISIVYVYLKNLFMKEHKMFALLALF